MLVCFTACRETPRELKQAEALIETNPDSSLNILRHVAPSGYNPENRALYRLLMIRSLDKKMLPLQPDSLLDFSIAYYEQHPDANRLASCYLYKGRTFKYYFQYEKAVEYFLKALDQTKDTEDHLLPGRICMDLGDIYLMQNDYVQAREKYKAANKHFAAARNQELAFYALLNIGRTYRSAKDFGTANRYFKAIAPLAKDSMQQGDLLQETGKNFFDTRQYDSALYYYRHILHYPYISYNRAIRYYNLANLFFSTNRVDSAYYYACNAFRYKPLIRTQRDCYRILTNAEYLRGHLPQMSVYMNRYVQLSDSIRKIDAQIKGSYMETTYAAHNEAHESRIQKWISWAVAFILLVCFALLTRNILRKVGKEKKAILETHTEEKVGIHKKVIENKRSVFLRQIEERKKVILANLKNAGSREREHQLHLLYKEMLHYDESRLFFPEMDTMLNGLVTKLKSRYGTLTEKELMLCCYLLLHIPTYDMLILFGYKSDDSLKSLKRRLSPKLNLQNATQLEDFLFGILSGN